MSANTGYVDAVQTAISANSPTVAMAGRTETERFTARPQPPRTEFA